jgi:hypothetical protein
MTSQHKTTDSIQAISGAVLVGLGLHILLGNLDRAAAQWTTILGNTAGDALGLLPSVVLASSQAAQAYALDHQGFWQCLLRTLVSFWPLLLIIAGAVLLRDVFADKVKTLPISGQYFKKNTFKSKDTGCRFRCPSFDV